MGQHPVLSPGLPIFQQNLPKYPIFGGPWRPYAFFWGHGGSRGWSGCRKTCFSSFL